MLFFCAEMFIPRIQPDDDTKLGAIYMAIKSAPFEKVIVVLLAWSNDPESYVGGSVTTRRVSHAGQVKGDDTDKKGYPGPRGRGLGVGLKTQHRKKS
jgi:hypothetical protein